jgi:hypothetical protein
MDDNIGKAIGGIAVAAISAVTFVAYRHPKAYVKLQLSLILAMLVVACGVMIWDLRNL